jgi:hypothetical protein
MAVLTAADGPLPSSPMKGEVPHRVSGAIERQARLFTSPFMGEAGRGPCLSVVYREHFNA